MDRTLLAAEADRLVGFARAARHPLGFGWLDDDGALVERPVELWISCRMTHVFSLQVVRGDAGSRAAAQHGVDALRGPLRDTDNGGWFAGVAATGPTNPRKEAYGHAFVVLAAASAVAAGLDGAELLLADALQVLEERFWDDEQGMPVESWNRAWLRPESYRGVNATMHTVEALLAAHHVTGDPVLLERAERATTRVVHGFGRAYDFRLPEHFTSEWQPLPDYNRDDPAHPFRPYGVTTGHLLEWSRLTLQLRHALGERAPAWMVQDAQALFDRAVADGWQDDDVPGFCYTTDFDGVPVITQRMHWVLAEAVAAAWVLFQVTGEAAYRDRSESWLDLALSRFADPEGGSWWHELDVLNRPAATVWHGKPDVYHAYQAVLTPTLPLASSYVAAVDAVARRQGDPKGNPDGGI